MKAARGYEKEEEEHLKGGKGDVYCDEQCRRRTWCEDAGPEVTEERVHSGENLLGDGREREIKNIRECEDVKVGDEREGGRFCLVWPAFRLL